MQVSRRAVALALVLAAAAADAAGAHGLAFYALVAAVPASAAAGLAALGRTIDAGEDEIVLLQALLWGLLIVLLVLGCASRSHALAVDGVPTFARSTLVAALAVLCVKAVLATGARLRGRPAIYSSSTSAS
jgi:hypothetical protein